MKGHAPLSAVLLLCAWLVLSQHRGSDGQLWWRTEHAPVTEAECHAMLRAVSGLPKVGPTKWYDTTTDLLRQQFGTMPTPTKGSWVACWPEDVWDADKGTAKWATPDW